MENKAKLSTIFEDAIKILTNPIGFYREMPKTGGFSDPLIFVLVMAIIIGLVIAVLSLFGAGIIGSMAAGFGAIIIMPVFAVIGSFIGAAIVFVIWKLMGSGESYETAYRCIAYAAAIYPISTVLGLIPYVGTIVGLAWGMYLMIVASIEVHQLNRTTAYIVFGILGALLLVMNLGSEMTARRMASQAEVLGKHFEGLGKQLEQSDEMTPEQTGKSVGDFIEGMNKATTGVTEKAASDDTEAAPQEYDNEGGDVMTPEQAGKALGDFLKGFSEATKGMVDSAPTNESSVSPATAASDTGTSQ